MTASGVASARDATRRCPASAASAPAALEQGCERELQPLRIATTAGRAQLGIVESVVQRAQDREAILQPGKLRRVGARFQTAIAVRAARARDGRATTVPEPATQDNAR